MKPLLLKTLSFLILFVVFASCNHLWKDEYQNNLNKVSVIDSMSSTYYWCDGKKIPLTVNHKKFTVVVETSKYDNITRSNVVGTNTIDNYSSLGIKPLTNCKTPISLTSFTLSNVSNDNSILEDAVYFAPYYRTEDGSEIGITNNLSVQLSGEQDYVKLEEIAAECNLQVLGQNEFDQSIYVLSCTKDSKGNALEMANYIYESGLFEYASPEFIVESMPATNPNDTYFSVQWYLYNTSSGVDINYLNAINNFAFPYLNDIIVAVIDDGVYSGHEDLPLYDISYDAHTGTRPSMLYGDHGTQVAGIIGATTNNNRGITGIASGVKIMPISICYTDEAIINNTSPSTSFHFANAIRFAVNNGARIINNSWGSESSTPIPDINNAITYAQKNGCIVVFAAGNSNGAILQPAAGAPTATLIVGAVGQNGYKESYSCYGSSIDVVAPGAGIWTTDISNGYYYATGTSYAAPQVSAIAALIWGINPNLPSWRVIDIIEQSVHKVGGNEYETLETRLNGPWNKFVGYGLVDAYLAVSAVTGQAPSAPILYTELPELIDDDLFDMEIDPDEAYSPAYLAEYYGYATASVYNYDPSVTYVWTSTLPPYYGFDSTFTVEFESESDQPVLHEIKCQALKNGYSTTSGMTLVVVPRNYSY